MNAVLQNLVACGLIALVGGLSVPAALAQSRPPPPRAIDGGASLRRLNVTVNKSRTIRITDAFSDILVGSSEIADVIPLSDQTIYVLGKKTGTTNVSILDSNRRVVTVVDVEVAPDTAGVTDKIQAGGAGGIRVRSSGDQLVLEGSAPDATTVDRAVEIARSASSAGVINATRVASPQQVMLKVRFVEVNRNAGRELGIRYFYQGRTRTGVIGANARSSRVDPGLSLPTSPSISPAIGDAIVSANPFAAILARFANNSRLLDVYIEALEEKGLVRRLAEPNLVALSGGIAEFHAGGEVPIPVAQTSTVGSVPVITVQYKEFGVKLRFAPTVLSNGLINMELNPEVSDVDPTIQVSTGGGISVPGFVVRKARTTMELRDGQSFAMAGLLQNINESTVEQLPWLGTIPVIGALFRSTQFQQRETELVVIVTPHLVRPGKPGDKLDTPLDTTLPANDLDLFVAGQLEIPKERLEYIRTKGAALGPYGHILTEPKTVPVIKRTRVQ